MGRARVLSGLVGLLLLGAPAWAYDDGRSGSGATGCGNCHGSADLGVTAVLSASSTSVAPGDVVDITLTLTSSDVAHVAGGLSVDATQGVFTAGTGTKVLRGDITHTTPRSFTGGSTSWTFQWTAPAVDGVRTLFAAGNAVNLDGRATNEDGWDLAMPLNITVDDPCDDADRDGFDTCEGDCDDGNAAVFPGAPERCNGVDDDCDEAPDDAAIDAPSWFFDGDGDGVGGGTTTRACALPADHAAEGGDCDDDDGVVFPGAVEVWYDDLDQDCSGGSDFDQDGDGVLVDDDCDDTDATVQPGAVDAFYDGVDADCAGNDDFDADFDGFASASFGGTDCDDGNAVRYPGAPDPSGDGVVTDCDLADPGDRDFDGFASVAAGGADCDDTNGARNPDALEIWYDGTDQDCDGNDDDQDVDGVSVGTDCDDTDPARTPGTAEVWYDGIDGDCLGGDDFDQDADGDRRLPEGTDCDDVDADVSPIVVEIWYDGTDQNCDGNDQDQDGDGVDRVDDQDDTDPSVGAPDPVDPVDTAETDLDDTDVDETEDTDPADTDQPTDTDNFTPPASCGCASSGPGAGAAGWLLALGLLRRRR